MQIHELFLINLLCIWAIFASFREGMIFGWLREWIEDRLKSFYLAKVSVKYSYQDLGIGEIIRMAEEKAEEKVDYYLKPVFGCPVCMPSLWASPVYLIASLSGFISYPWYLFPIYVLSMVGLNYLLSQLISKEVDVNLNQ